VISLIFAFNMEFPYAPRGGYYAVLATQVKAISPVLAFWFFGCAVICFICYIVAKRRDQNANLFGREGFKLYKFWGRDR